MIVMGTASSSRWSSWARGPATKATGPASIIPSLGRRGEGQTFSPESVYGPAVLSELYQVILQRRGASPDESYTARLFAGGQDRILKKVGEEAAEVIIAAKNGEAKFLIEETADLLYHLLVLLAEGGIEPGRIWECLAARRRGSK